MIEIDFHDFHDQNYKEIGYELYVMKNGLGDVLYVGISKWSISGHIAWLDNRVIGNTAVGQKIADHLPDSLKWKIQLWTLEDCVNLCKDEFHIPPSPDISFIEPSMINKLSPILNVVCNTQPGKDTTPRSKKEIEREKLLDEAYHKIFEKHEK